MTSFAITSDNRPKVANDKALAATVELRRQREDLNLEIELLQSRARKLSVQICAIEREVYRSHMDSTSRS
jgi:chaperonin cofactor prefoldin